MARANRSASRRYPDHAVAHEAALLCPPTLQPPSCRPVGRFGLTVPGVPGAEAQSYVPDWCDDSGVDEDGPPRRILRAASLAILPGHFKPREGSAFMVSWYDTPAVLRSVPARGGATAADQFEDTRWLHGFLAELVALGFPAPRPLPAFDGGSWSEDEGAVWELLSFLPGESVGWAAQPCMEALGEFLACYHGAVRQIGLIGQRPSALPLAEVPQVLLGVDLRALRIDPGRTAVICQLAEQLAHDLGKAGKNGERLVIHGDFTNDNVIASGTPPRPTGVIDFALAHVENPLADIAYALWRSGRPGEHAEHLDLGKVRQYMHGYARCTKVSAAEASIIPTFLMGRGLQMIAKRVRRGSRDIGMLAEVQWLSANAAAVSDALQAALP